MLKNLNTKMKLLLFPFMFVVIVFVSVLIYLNYSNLAEKRNEVALETEGFVQDLLKGRISVYQFLRNQNAENIQKVRDNFSALDKKVLDLKEAVSVERNKILCDEIIESSKNYMEDFEAFSKDYSKDKEETESLKATLNDMVKSGEILEVKIREINKSALDLKQEAHNSLNNILIALAIVAIISFILISLIISKIVITSLDNFKIGLISFFSYLNRSSKDISLLDDSSKDE
ncbi:MAG: chemotaxis protein, partial [Arcobacter sp.]|nr:chemotaxis protein [Arcobacter sp.]